MSSPKFGQAPLEGVTSTNQLIIGSPEGVQGAINHLHLLQYAERLEWSRPFTIPESGILITPEQGEVSYRSLGVDEGDEKLTF